LLQGVANYFVSMQTGKNTLKPCIWIHNCCSQL